MTEVLSVSSAITSETENEWSRLFAAKQNGTVLNVEVFTHDKIPFGDQKVKCWIIDFGDGIRGLVPQDETNIVKFNEFKRYVGEEVPIVIVKIDQENNLLLCSQKRAVDRLKEIALKRMKVGEQYQSIVRFVTDQNIFVETLGMRFAFHRDKLNMTFKDLRDTYTIGDDFPVRVTEIDQEKQRIVVKPVVRDAWQFVNQKYKVRNPYPGIIKWPFEQGYIVEMEPGVDAYCPFPQDWDKKKLLIGDRVEVVLTRINSVKKRMGGDIKRQLRSKK